MADLTECAQEAALPLIAWILLGAIEVAALEHSGLRTDSLNGITKLVLLDSTKASTPG